MHYTGTVKLVAAIALCLAATSCGRSRSADAPIISGNPDEVTKLRGREAAGFDYTTSSIWDLFGTNRSDQTVQVNKYIWTATLDVLNFLPIQNADPFTGVIVTGFGNPPGGGRAYRATVHISDPALDARALNVSLQTKGGPVDASTARAVEDSILARARQLRIADNKL